jgi:hypothetical protein
MALPPTSDAQLIRLIDVAGNPLGVPREWTTHWVEVAIPVEAWGVAELWRGTEPMPLTLRRIGGEVRVVAEWPRSGTGNYELRLISQSAQSRLLLTVRPEKLTPSSYAQLLEDLETRIPASVAVGLQRIGGLSGLELLPPQESTIAEEIHRLRRAITGTAQRRGLADVLRDLARDPYRVLASQELWVRRGSARRPHPARLVQALTRASNIAVDKKPLRVLDKRVTPDVDVYENRLVKAFAHQVERRLHRVRRLELSPTFQAEVETLAQRLRFAKRQASFLMDVGELDHIPDRMTMVLLMHPLYRATLEGYLDFQRRLTIRLDTDALDSPLENVPYLYQIWGTLMVLQVLLSIGEDCGYRLTQQRLVGRDGGGAFVRVLPDGKPALTMLQLDTRTEVRLIPERSYSVGPGLRSITYSQRPDVAIEVRAVGERPRVYLFDPKYKLDVEVLEGLSYDGKPKKIDIDKMHAYRDAIRATDGERVVEYAAILYPGPEVIFAGGIEALHADPGNQGSLRSKLSLVIGRLLS